MRAVLVTSATGLTFLPRDSFRMCQPVQYSILTDFLPREASALAFLAPTLSAAPYFASWGGGATPPQHSVAHIP
jgi:hypothetical protein